MGATLNAEVPVGLPWAVSLGFLRLMTHRRVLARPMATSAAVAAVRSWLTRRHVQVLVPGPDHLDIVGRLLEEAGTAGTLTTDAHLAALAIEHQVEVCTCDADFARFSGVRWRDPLVS